MLKQTTAFLLLVISVTSASAEDILEFLYGTVLKSGQQ